MKGRKGSESEMAADAPAQSLRIGARLRHQRKLRGLSLREVAAASTCSEGYLSKIENDKAVPSLATLHRIAAALGVNLSYFFGNPEPGSTVVARHGARPMIDLDPLRRGHGLRLERIVPYSESHLLQCNIHIVEPGGASEGQITHEGEEVGYVLEGRVELQIEDEAFVLNAGDAFYFDSHRPHGYRNIGEDTARILWMNTPPTF
jgi:transcriptional regulator with XRE-family HTH domain